MVLEFHSMLLIQLPDNQARKYAIGLAPGASIIRERLSRNWKKFSVTLKKTPTINPQRFRSGIKTPSSNRINGIPFLLDLTNCTLLTRLNSRKLSYFNLSFPHIRARKAVNGQVVDRLTHSV